MSPVTSQFEPRARTSAAPGPGRCPAHLLVELLALNEEMIEQLHLERLSDAGTADFLTNMIGQHEKAAALLRAQLKKHQTVPA